MFLREKAVSSLHSSTHLQSASLLSCLPLTQNLSAIYSIIRFSFFYISISAKFVAARKFSSIICRYRTKRSHKYYFAKQNQRTERLDLPTFFLLRIAKSYNLIRTNTEGSWFCILIYARNCFWVKVWAKE